MYGGLATGFIPGIPLGSFFALMGFTLCSRDAILTGFKCGISITTAIFAAPVAAITSVPFTVAAIKTRKFKTNDEIRDAVEAITSINEPAIQQLLINQIIEKYNNFKWLSITSLESQFLINSLRGNDTLENKWKILCDYLQAKTVIGDDYVNNGKKLFNAILETKDFALNWGNFDWECSHDLNSEGLSPYHLAAKNGNLEIVEHYIYKSGDWINMPASESQRNKTALDFAIENNHSEIVKLLLRKGASSTSTKDEHLSRLAALKGHTETIDAIAEERGKYHDPDLLHFAVSLNQKKVVNHLLAKCLLNVDKKSVAFNEMTPVQIADKKGHYELAQTLVDEHKADDSDFNLLKMNLMSIKDRLYSEEWNKAGVGFFSSQQVPSNIKNLRKKYLPKNLDIQKMSRANIYRLANVLSRYDFGSSYARNEETNQFYEFINNVIVNATTRDRTRMSMIR